MFSSKKLAILVVLVMIAAAVLAACGPTPEPAPPETIIQTVEVEVTKIVVEEGEEKTVVVTEVVEVEVTAPPPEPTEVPEAEPETYRMGMFEDATTRNYWAYYDPDSSVWNGYVHSGVHPAFYTLAYPNLLFVPSAADGMLEPAVQEGDKWVGTMKLHPGIMWSDGEELTVDDFIFTAETVRDFTLGGNWIGAYDWGYLDSFEKVDDYTVKVYFKEQPGLAIFNNGVGFAPMMPQHFWAEAVEGCRSSEDAATCLYAADGTGEPSAGSFIFSAWEAGAFAEKVANPDYFQTGSTYTFYANGAYKEVNPKLGYEFCIYGDCTGDVELEYVEGPHVPNVVFSLYGTQDAAVLAMASGEVDFLLNSLGLQRGLRDQVVGNPDLAAFQNPSNGFRYLAFNVRKAPHSSVEFRQAVAHLIDKEYITTNVLQNTAIAVYGMVPEGNTYWYNPNAPALGKGMTREERVAAAIELLKAGGFSWDVEPTWDAENAVVVPGSTLKGPDGAELAEIELLSPSAGYDPMRATAAIWIAQWCNEIGIPVKANPTGFNTIIPRVFEPDPATGEIEFDWFILGWSLGDPSLPTFHEAFFSCRQDAKEGGNNAPGYCDAEFDEWANGLLTATDLETAREFVWKMDDKMATDLPYITLFTTPILEFYAKARVEYPFIEVLNGLSNLSGQESWVMSK